MATKAQRVNATIKRRAEWAKTLKAGRPCTDCGRTLAGSQMHWHHRDPATKSFKISQGAYRHSRPKILAEIEKCDLLCAPCHRARHAALIPHGSRGRYRRGCRCDECRGANALYRRELKRRRVRPTSREP